MRMPYVLYFIFLVWIQPGFRAQHLYYKNIQNQVLGQFADSNSKIVFVKKDSIQDFSAHFNYVLKFFPQMEYQRVTVIYKPSQKIARVKPTFMCFFKSPDKRRYKIFISTKAGSAPDSVLLSKISTNSQVGLIARQLGHVHEFSTDGFFDLLGWHFKQLSRKAKKNIEHDNELKLLELGLGYQLLSLSREEEEKLGIEKWLDAKAYAKHARREKNKYMSPEAIRNFINDMPVYVTHQYK